MMWVGWETLHHAYGPATDVPQLLRDIASDNAAVRSDAMRKREQLDPVRAPWRAGPKCAAVQQGGGWPCLTR